MNSAVQKGRVGYTPNRKKADKKESEGLLLSPHGAAAGEVFRVSGSGAGHALGSFLSADSLISSWHWSSAHIRRGLRKNERPEVAGVMQSRVLSQAWRKGENWGDEEAVLSRRA